MCWHLPRHCLQVDDIGELMIADDIRGRILVHTQFALRTWHTTQEVSFARRIAVGIVDKMLQAREHARTGAFTIAIAPIAVEVNERGLVQYDQCDGRFVYIMGGYIAVDVTIGLETECRGRIGLLKAKLDEELKEIRSVELATDVGCCGRRCMQRKHEEQQQPLNTVVGGGGGLR